MKNKFLILTVLVLFPMYVFLQSTIYNSGAGTFVVPCNVSSITVKLWGGGGGGGGDNTNGGIKGGGGAGGGYTTSVLAVVPGQNIAYSVGAGGAGGAAGGGNGVSGGNTTFGALSANGGTAGMGCASGNPGVGGAGANANGTNGTTGNGSTGAGGAAGMPGGGAGGAAAAAGSAGNPGSAPGGGGGGGFCNSGFLGNRAGGAGANGRVEITYTITSAGVDQNIAACATTATMAATAPAAGTGTWTCISGCAGVGISSPNAANSGITGLTPGTNTTLRWTVSGAGCTSTTDDILITTSTGPLCPTYCNFTADDCASFTEPITNVSFSTINNSSSCGYTPVGCASVITGSTYTLSVTGGGSGTYGSAAFIDWNSDGDFNDASEYNVISNSMTPGTPYSISITVPGGATCNAIIKMRIVYVWNGTVAAGESCSTGDTYGENEDYCLSILCCSPNCSNSIQDCGETGVDCGGPCVSTCFGSESCTDNILNQDETAIDCGGVCPACGSSCVTAWTNQSMVPVEGSIVDASLADQTITACTNVTYNNSGNNWVHGVYVSPTSTGFVSSNASGALPEPNTNSGLDTYKWAQQTNNFTSDNSGQNITANGWFVETGALNSNPGNNLGWPVSGGTDLGPFCFTTVVSCTGFEGDNPAFLHFRVTSDSYSGSWTNTNCGLETSSGANSLSYTLRCPVAMPIDFLQWNGLAQGKKNKLFWSVANDIQGNIYELYKGDNDGKNWNNIGRIDVKTIDIKNLNAFDYVLYDDNPNNGITYYKIKRIETNGDATESNIIGVLNKMELDKNFIIPNPVQQNATAFFNSNSETTSQIEIISMDGKVLYKMQFETFEGVNSYTFDSSNLNNGFYILRVKNEKEQILIKFNK